MGRRRSVWPRSHRRSLWPRRRRSNSGDAALGLFVFGAVLVAALGVYLLIVGAIALIGWLVAVAAKSQAQVAKPQFATVASANTTPIAPIPPNQTFHAVVSVSPDVFDDLKQVESTASRAFATWARQLPSAPRDPSDSIKALTLRTRLIGRLTTRLDGRRFAWRSAAYRGRDRVAGSPPLRPENLDPYNPPDDLRTRSRYLSLCRTCDGDGKIECGECGGAARITCGACKGAGKVEGLTKNNARRLLNCKTCKGKSTIACATCSKGQLDCRSCERNGRVEHWLEIEGGPRDGDVQVEPDGQLTQAFRWGVDGVPATDAEVQQDAKAICSITRDRLLSLDDLPAQVPDHWRQVYWNDIQAKLQAGERVVEQTFTLLEVPSIEIAYGLGDDHQAISLEGLRMLAPPIATDFVFASRATALHRLVIGLALVPLAVFVAYAIRGSYFLVNPATYGVLGCAAAACAIIYVVFRQSTLGRAPRKWLAGAVLPIGAATALAFMIEPSQTRARSLIDGGQLDQAKAELEALGGKSDPDIAPLWADLYLKKALAQTDCDATKKYLSEMPVTASSQRALTQKHADELALAVADAALKQQQLDAAEDKLRCASDDARISKAGKTLRSQIALARAHACMSSRDWSCVFAGADAAAAVDAGSEAKTLRADARARIKGDVDATIAALQNERDLRARVEKQRSAADLWSRYLAEAEKSGAEPAPIVALKTSLKRDEQQLARVELIARQKREAEEKRQAEIAARAEQQRQAEEERDRRRREALERASQPQGLLCCDGSMSPTCSCGGSHRGCCSHHGGVCGCR